MWFSGFGFVDWIRFRPGYQIVPGVVIWPMVPLHSVLCAWYLRKEICWVILFSSSTFHPLGEAPILRFRPVEMRTVYIIRHLGTGEYRGFLLALPVFLPSAIFYLKLGSVGLCSKIRVRSGVTRETRVLCSKLCLARGIMLKLCRIKVTLPPQPP